METVSLAGRKVRDGAYTFVGKCRDFSSPARQSVSDAPTQKKIVLFIVCVALLLDNMLYMVIVPIVNDYFKPLNNTGIPVRHLEMEHIPTTLPEIAHARTLPAHRGMKRHRQIQMQKLAPPHEESSKDAMMGLLFASKAIVQLVANPFTGAFIDRVGYVMPLTMGLLVMFVSTTVFAAATSFWWLFVARSLQGLGSALADTASFGLIADRFHDEKERSTALGIALAFISFGSLVAPPFGGVLYEFAGKMWPFLILAIVCFMDAMLLLLVEIPSKKENSEIAMDMPKNQPGTPIYKLFVDPYIAVIAGSLMIANFPLAFLEPTIAEWMEKTMNATKWQIGLVWLPAFIPHVIGVYLTVKISQKYRQHQWLVGGLGLVIIGVSTSVVSVCTRYEVLFLPLATLCFGIALIDTALLPTLAFLVDVRYTSVYGSVYAIADISYSIAYALGPILAGQAVHVLGYLKMNVSIGIANMMFAPVLLLLRNVYDWNTNKGERAMLLSDIAVDGKSGSPSADFINNNKSQSTENFADFESEKSDINGSANGLIHPNPVAFVKEKNESIKMIPRPRPRPRVNRGGTKQNDTISLKANGLEDDVKQVTPIKGKLRSLSIQSFASDSYENNIQMLKTEVENGGFEVTNPLFNP